MFCTPRLCGLFLPDWGGGHELTFNAFTYDEGGVLAETRHIMVIKKTSLFTYSCSIYKYLLLSCHLGPLIYCRSSTVSYPSYVYFQHQNPASEHL